MASIPDNTNLEQLFREKITKIIPDDLHAEALEHVGELVKGIQRKVDYILRTKSSELVDEQDEVSKSLTQWLKERRLRAVYDEYKQLIQQLGNKPHSYERFFRLAPSYRGTGWSAALRWQLLQKKGITVVSKILFDNDTERIEHDVPGITSDVYVISSKTTGGLSPLSVTKIG